MAKNEPTSPKVEKVAAKVLKTGEKMEARTLAGTALTQAPDKRKPRSRRNV